jgi:murein DD-endopeptidase MepM/ murein hydrolase activator NlpD
VRQSKAEYLHEVAGIQAANAQVTATIQSAGSSSYDSTPSSSGLIWPVNGPVVSGFGLRWGRMHTGIDIGVGYGTPIHAAASGTVIFAGWMGGYGNFVIVDHGGGLSTAYAHQSSIAVGGGAVSQGQVLGYVGCTGHCFGPHLHFEVRINGSPVDPLGYL